VTEGACTLSLFIARAEEQKISEIMTNSVFKKSTKIHPSYLAIHSHARLASFERSWPSILPAMPITNRKKELAKQSSQSYQNSTEHTRIEHHARLKGSNESKLQGNDGQNSRVTASVQKESATRSILSVRILCQQLAMCLCSNDPAKGGCSRLQIIEQKS
jgi:hypothetical protein